MTKLFILLQHILPTRVLTQACGYFASTRNPLIKNFLISVFIKVFRVDMDEAIYPRAQDYENFNDFFTRSLKEGLRPLADPEQYILCPADGAISQLGKIREDRILQAKGRDYSPAELLGSRELGELFLDGDFATIYLSPKDYHRVHMPLSGNLQHTRYRRGGLFSVNKVTAEGVPGLFARNERMVNFFETDHGLVAVVMVGAMIVAGIDTVWGGGRKDGPHPIEYSDSSVQLGAGEEMGRFYLGSTAIILFQKGQIDWLDGLEAGRPVTMGQALAQRVAS